MGEVGDCGDVEGGSDVRPPAREPLGRLKTILLPLADLRPANYNPRRMSVAQRKRLRASLKRYGMLAPIVWNRRSGSVVWGHQRLRELLDAGVKQTDVVPVDLDEAEEKRLNVLGNSPTLAGDFVPHMLEPILRELKELEPVAFEDSGLGELAELEDLLPEDWRTLDESLDREVAGSGDQLTDLVTNGHVWESETVSGFQLPRLRSDMLGSLPEEWADAGEILPVVVRAPEYPYRVYVWRSASVAGFDPSTVGLCFYRDDPFFDAFWTDPPRHVEFLRQGWQFIIPPNWSMYSCLPRIPQLWAKYKQLWVARYWQECGLPIIPHCPPPRDEKDDVLLGLPKGAPCISTQYVCGARSVSTHAPAAALRIIAEALRPKVLLCYAKEKFRAAAQKLFEGMDTRLVWVRAYGDYMPTLYPKGKSHG